MTLVVGAVGVVDVVATVVSPTAGVVACLMTLILAWIGLLVCFPLAHRHPRARVVGTALAISMTVGLMVGALAVVGSLNR